MHYEGRPNTAANYDVISILLSCVAVVVAVCILLSLSGQRKRKRVSSQWAVGLSEAISDYFEREAWF